MVAQNGDKQLETLANTNDDLSRFRRLNGLVRRRSIGGRRTQEVHKRWSNRMESILNERATEPNQ